MRDLLPRGVIEALQDRYAAGVENAEAHFDQHSADEDSVTGALGQALAARQPMHFAGPAGRYSVNVSYQKLRGRGQDAPERLFGADGIFQIEIVGTQGERVRTKGLPFQAKKGWKGKDAGLLRQVKLMERAAPGGMVIDYSIDGYRACTAQAAIAANGNRRQVDRFGSMKKLSQVLSTDFLDCAIGKIGLFYDRESERFHKLPDLRGDLDVITTTVRRTE